MRVFHGRLSNFVSVLLPSFPVGIEGRTWVVIVLLPDHCFSIYFTFDSRSSVFGLVVGPSVSVYYRWYFTSDN